MLKDKASRLDDGTYTMAVKAPNGEIVSIDADTKQHCIIAGQEVRKGNLTTSQQES